MKKKGEIGMGLVCVSRDWLRRKICGHFLIRVSEADLKVAGRYYRPASLTMVASAKSATP